MSVVAKEMMNPDYGLFVVAQDGAYHPSGTSDINPDHLAYFEFAGKVVALAIANKQVAHVYRLDGLSLL
jgi:hypothetical protein